MLRRYRAVLLALTLFALLPSVGRAGQGGSITLVNGTPYNWKTSGQSSSQMSRWSFPGVITAGSTATVDVEWSDSYPSSSQSGMVTFSLGETGLSFQLRASAPGEVFNLSVELTNFSTLGNPQGSIINLGWNPNGSVNFILAGKVGEAGEADSFTSSKPPNAWMQENLDVLGSRELRHLCIPGSHDAGMSKLKTSTSLAKPCNTVTQTRGVLQQLHAGARYFDIRPVVHRDQFYTGHYSCDPQAGCQGAVGQSLDSIIDDVNSYIAANHELVVLSLSNDLNTDGIYRPFTGDEWCRLLSKLMRLNGRFVPNPTVEDLTTLTLEEFIGEGAAVVVVGKPSNFNITLDTLGCSFVPAEKGFYTPQSFPVFDSYSNTNNLGFMQQDQLTKLQAHNPEDGAFLLSWTLTLQGQENLTCSNTILGLAAQAHPALYQNVLPASNHRTPNILSVDKVESRDIAALAMAVNSKASWNKPRGYVIYKEVGSGTGIFVAHSTNSDLSVGTAWSGTRMDPAIKTSATPAAVSFAGGLHVFYKGADDSKIYIAQPKGGNVLDGGSWKAQPLNPEFKTSTTPGVAVLGNTLYMFYRGEGDDSKVYIARSSGNVSDGATWSSTSLNSEEIKTSAAPAVAAFNGTLYLFYRDADGKIHIASSQTGNVFDGSSWKQSLLEGIVTDEAPAAVVYKGVLYLFYKGKNDSNIFIAYPKDGKPMEGMSWLSVRLNQGINTTSVPRPVVIGDSLYLFYKGLETFIWIAQPLNGNVLNGDGWWLRNLNTAINTGVGPGAAAM